MGFWAWWTGNSRPSTANITDNGDGGAPLTVGPSYTPGDPDGFELISEDVESRSLPSIFAMPWNGWPADWSTPSWDQVNRLSSLVDTAWDCIDLNARVLSTMPVYKTRNGRVVEPEIWMTNPDPRVYTSWSEFAKQLFRDYQLGEVFVYATDYFSTGYPMFFRVLPPCMVKVEIEGAQRRYWLGTVDITADVLHIRYQSSIHCARGTGPLDVAGCRLVASGVLARYVADMVSAPPPYMTLETDELLNATDAQEILDQWIESRTTNRGQPAVLDGGVKLQTHQMNARDMALLELSQFTDSRIAVKLGVPPPLVGLPTGDSMTYSTVSGWTDHHDRLTLRPFATDVMAALSNWALGPGRAVELDRDEYSRPALPERAQAYKTLSEIPGAITADEVRAIERTLYATSTPGAGAALPSGGAT